LTPAATTTITVTTTGTTTTTTTTTLPIVGDLAALFQSTRVAGNDGGADAEIATTIATAVKDAATNVAGATADEAAALLDTDAIKIVRGSVEAIANFLPTGGSDGGGIDTNEGNRAAEVLTKSIEEFMTQLVTKALESPDAEGESVREDVAGLVSVAWSTTKDAKPVQFTFQADCKTTNMTEFGLLTLAALAPLGVAASSVVEPPKVSCGSLNVELLVESEEVEVRINELVKSGKLIVGGLTASVTTSATAATTAQTITLEIEDAIVTVPLPGDGSVKNDDAPRAEQDDVLIVIYYPQSNTTESLFPTPSTGLGALRSPIVSISLGDNGNTPADKLNGNVEFMLVVNTGGEYEEQVPDKSLNYFKCVYWEYAADLDALDGSGSQQLEQDAGAWSEDGCKMSAIATDDSNTTTVTCSCEHLTHFAVLFTSGGREESRAAWQTEALEWISKLGVGIEVLAIVLTLGTFIAFHDLVKRPEHIIANLCIAVLIGHLMFVLGGHRKEGQSDTSCRATAAVTQYFLLASWSWQLVEAVHLYKVFVEVMGESTKFAWYLLFGWGVPLIFVIPSVIAYKEDYGYTNVIEGEDVHMCWIDTDSKANLFYLVPAMCGLVFNIVVCGIVMKSVAKATTSTKSRAIAVFTFGTTMGLVYVFAALVKIKDGGFAFELLTCIGLATSGVVIFFFHVYRKEDFKHKLSTTFGSSKNSKKKLKLPAKKKFGGGTSNADTLTTSSAPDSTMLTATATTSSETNSRANVSVAEGNSQSVTGLSSMSVNDVPAGGGDIMETSLDMPPADEEARLSAEPTAEATAVQIELDASDDVGLSL
jgi:hypothetical protein